MPETAKRQSVHLYISYYVWQRQQMPHKSKAGKIDTTGMLIVGIVVDEAF